MHGVDSDIDFVIPWVDGSDPDWIREFIRFRNPGAGEDPLGRDVDAAIERYRDWGLLKYWFRGVEKFAPWVRRIHFITWGHIPDWLDTSDPRIHIVKHRDYIPEEFLPVFSSCPIELLMHRIEGLSERFVYFNDDMFLCRELSANRFFRNGLPCDVARLNVLHDDLIDHNALECVRIINRRYRKNKSVGNNLGKWFNPRYTVSDMLKTATLMPWSFFPGFKNHHAPQPFLRETFERLWNEETDELNRSCRSRFRTATDLIQWLMRYEQIARGDFSPHGYGDTGLFKITDDNAKYIAGCVAGQRCSMVCINDNNELQDFNRAGKILTDAFETILKDKSSYEK